MRRILLGALHCILLSAVPLFSQVSSPALIDPHLTDGDFHWFSLAETPAEVAKALGPPRMTAPFADFVSWQYQIGVEDMHEYSHQLVFRNNGQLVSVARNYEIERTVDEWFPADATEVYSYVNEHQQSFDIRLRRLSEGRLLLAMGVSKPGQKTGQIVLIKESELRYFYPWLADQVQRNAESPLPRR